MQGSALLAETPLPKKALTYMVYSCFKKPDRFCTSESSKKQLQIRYRQQTNKGNAKPELWVSGPHLTLPIGEETQAPLFCKWARCVNSYEQTCAAVGQAPPDIEKPPGPLSSGMTHSGNLPVPAWVTNLHLPEGVERCYAIRYIGY